MALHTADLWSITPIPRLEDLESSNDKLGLRTLEDLPEIHSQFFLSPLKDKPQDPILDALKLQAEEFAIRRQQARQKQEDAPPPPPPPPSLPKELAILTQISLEESNVVSWDRFRNVGPQYASTTAFLSEQSDGVLASARYHFNPEASRTAHSVSIDELHRSIQMTVIGTSSRLFRWDGERERFVYVVEGTRHLRIQDRDEVISSSFVERFLSIGTLLRRLEGFIKVLQMRTVKDGPTVHALAHALSTVLIWLRVSIVETSATDNIGLLASVWSRYEPFESVVNAISELYGRGLHVTPQQYPEFDSSPIRILSLIYRHLALHLERQSPRTVPAIFAHILTTTSQGYLHDVGVSIGYGGRPRYKQKPSQSTAARGLDEYDLGLGYDDDDGDGEDNIDEALSKIETEFPDFFPRPLLDILPTAQKSLILLRHAKPDHPLLGTESVLGEEGKRVRWLWAEEDILGAWDEFQPQLPSVSRGESVEEGQEDSPPPAPSGIVYPPEIERDFRVYDMPPGEFKTRSALQVLDKSSAALEEFIERFPEELPSVTPTLSHLTSLVFHKLLEHAETLSSTLLSIFLTSEDNLNVQLHLSLLRSYLLVTGPNFKTRLMDALFSDADEYGVDTAPHGMSIRFARKRTSKRPALKEGSSRSKQPWAIGLSAGLLEREIWPPVSGDLNFVLRSVIVDSLSVGRELGDVEEGGGRERNVVLEEASWRIGFSIKDLPEEGGRDGWMNPLSIEALDFLGIEYKPPRPMDVLVSPHILSKYQRVFEFTLRLFRVESALKSVFRMTRPSSNPLFETLAESRKLMLHFRFIAQSFVSTLSSYVFDTAIGGNFDPFLDKLSSSSSGSISSSSSPPARDASRFSDVFELEAAHSAVLDRILTACLLRTGQKVPAGLMMQALELVLEFCVVIGELSRGRLKEYEAAVMLEDVYGKFKARMGLFVQVLKTMVDKGPSTQAVWTPENASGARMPTGGTAALNHLLVRLDLRQWWVEGAPKAGTRR